jgi:hypothetical protein
VARGRRPWQAEGVVREWPSAWTVEAGTDGWRTLRLAVAPDGGQVADEGG